MRTKDPRKAEQIFNAALSLIVEEGIAGLKMAVLAKKADMATGTLYIYFPDKAGLLGAMYLYFMEQISTDIWSTEAPGADYEQRLRQKWYNYLRFVQRYPAEMIFFEQYHRSPFKVPEVIQKAGNLLGPLLTIIQEGQEAGILRRVPQALLVTQLIGPIQEMVAWSGDGSLPPLTDVADQAWEMAWAGIKR